MQEIPLAYAKTHTNHTLTFLLTLSTFAFQVDFHQPDGSTISNIISTGPDGDISMTYAFEWLHPEVAASDTQKVEELRGKHAKTAQMAVEKSIEAVRRLVQDGTIKA